MQLTYLGAWESRSRASSVTATGSKRQCAPRWHSIQLQRAVFPLAYRTLFGELLLENLAGRPAHYIDTMLDTLTARDKGLEASHGGWLIPNVATSYAARSPCLHAW